MHLFKSALACQDLSDIFKGCGEDILGDEAAGIPITNSNPVNLPKLVTVVSTYFNIPLHTVTQKDRAKDLAASYNLAG